MPRARKKPKPLSSEIQTSKVTASVGAGSDTGTPAAFALPLEKRTGGADRAALQALSPKERAKQEKRLGLLPGGRAGQVYARETVEGDVNGRKRRRHIHPLEKMEQKGMLTKGQVRAGLALSRVWEAQFTSGARGFEPKVDTSARPDAAALIGLRKKERFSKLLRLLPADSRAVCLHVCCEERFLRDGFSRSGAQMAVHLEQLVMGLAVLEEVV